MNTITPDTTSKSKRSHKKLAIGFAGVVLAGSIGFAAVASAQDDGPGGSGQGRPPKLTAEERCERADEIDARVTALLEKINGRKAKLEELKAKAQEAGRDQLVAKLEARLERINERIAKINGRYAKFEAWTAEHCAS